MNPFTYYASPTSPREYQSNANYYWYERMGATAELAEFDRAGIKAPAEVISNAHTMKWVEKEHARLARKAPA